MPTLPTGNALLDARAILVRAGLHPGMQFADFGCGSIGHFVFPASDLVGPEGKVYAVDILKSALAGIESRMKLERVANVQVVWGDIERPGGVMIAEGTMDLVGVMSVCGLLKKGPGALGEISRVLKPDGRVLLVDWKKTGESFGPPLAQRVSPDEIVPIVEKNGFAVAEAFEAGPHHWGLILRRA